MRRALVLVIAASCKDPAPMLVDGPGGDDAAAIDDAAIVDDAPPDAFTGVISDQARSGTRLKMRWNATADGVFYPSGEYYDSVVDTVCTRQHFEDGKDYCAPAAGFVSQSGTFGYADSGCTTFTVRAPASTMLGTFAGELTTSPTTTWKFIYRVGAINETVITGPAGSAPRPFWKFVGGVCTSTPTVGFNREITALSFVELTDGHEGSGRLKERWDIGSDGFAMIQRERAYDSTLSSNCDLSSVTTTTQICRPAGTRTTIHYSDAGCTQAKVSNPAEGAYALVGSTLHAIGAATATHPRYRKTDTGGCVQMAFDASAGPYALVGAPIAPIAEVTLALAPDEGNRLRPYSWTATDFSIQTGTYLDTLLALDCIVGGTCVPYPSATARRKYTDTDCTNPVDVFVYSGLQVPYVRTIDGLYKPVGAMYTNPSQQLFIPGGAPPDPCEADLELAGWMVYATGAALDSSMFEVMSVLTDP